MRITGIIWLEEIVEKLATKHRVEPDEVEEVFSNTPKFRFVESGHRENEDVYAALGQSDAGRYLIIFFRSESRRAHHPGVGARHDTR